MSNSTTDGSMLPISYVMSQQFTILDLYNQTTNFTLADLNSYRQYALVNSIIFSSQLGACAAILVILLMLTKQEKRRTTVFALNSLALLFNITGCLLECLYYTGSWYSPYAYLTSDYSMVSASAHSVSIAPGIFVILVVLCLEASLVLQVSVVCVTFSSAQRLAINIASGLVAGITVGFRVAQVAINIKCNIDAAAEACGNNQWLANAMAITQTVSICYFSAVFCGKLGWSLHQRRKMGMTQFGPMQIIFIGGAQTLVVPGLSLSITLLFPFPSSIICYLSFNRSNDVLTKREKKQHFSPSSSSQSRRCLKSAPTS